MGMTSILLSSSPERKETMDFYPPYNMLTSVFDECPGAIFTYLFLWRNASENELFIDKKSVKNDYLIELPLFLEYLSELQEAEVLNFHEDPESFYVILVRKIPGEGKILC